MAEPLSWTAIEETTRFLEAIRTADGFHTDLGLQPIHTDRTQTPDTAAPFTVIVATDITKQRESSSRSQTTLTLEMGLLIEFAIPSTGDNPELVAHRAIADIERAFGQGVRGMRGRVPGITLIEVVSARVSDAELDGTTLVIGQVTARAALVDSFKPA